MIRKPLLAVILVFLTLLTAGQAPFPSKDEIKQFLSSRTCVVLEDDIFSPYNAYVRKAVESFWKITPAEFVSAADFEARRSDPAYSFLFLTKTNFSRDKSKSEYTFINLLQGKKVGKIGEMPEICAVPLSSSAEDDLDYGYKLGAVLAFMQKHATLIADDPSLTGRRYLRFYNRNIPAIASRKILARTEDLAPGISDPEKIKSIYPGDFSIVSEEEIVKAIETKQANTLILHRVGPEEGSTGGFCYKMLIGADDADMYYYNQHNIDKANPNGFLPADFKRISGKQ